MQSALTSAKPAVAHLRVGVAEQVERVRAFPALVVRREERADVAEPGRAEQGVDQRVRDDVAVGVAGQAPLGVEANASEHERHALLERMCVDPEPDPQLRHRSSASGSSARESMQMSACSRPGWR